MLLAFSLPHTCNCNAVFCSVHKCWQLHFFSNLNNFTSIWRSNIHMGIGLKQWRKLLPNVLHEKLMFWIYLGDRHGTEPDISATTWCSLQRQARCLALLLRPWYLWGISLFIWKTFYLKKNLKTSAAYSLL